MASKNINENNENEECFVIMPISNQEGYEIGHFDRVYEDIFKPAIQKAGFKPFRVDDSKSSNVIHVNIIKRLIEAPMAICDLSTKNPNVMYELGIRQAFDKPVVLVGDNNPGEIFDINGINTHQYSKGLYYGDVIKDQNKISEMISATYNSHKDGSELTSLISIIKVNSAIIKTDGQVNESDLMKAMYNEILSMKSDINKLKNQNDINLKEEVRSLDKVNFRYKAIPAKFQYKESMSVRELEKQFNDILLGDEEIDIKVFKCITMIKIIQKKLENNNLDNESLEELSSLRSQLRAYIGDMQYHKKVDAREKIIL